MKTKSNPHNPHSIAVIGGGTAGYLTALALQRQLPTSKVTIIEAPSIPIIGVGESTVTSISNFLHDYLGLDVAEFYREVHPTWKLGIRFEWGRPGDYFFNYPFERIESYLAHHFGGNIHEGSRAAILMNQQRSYVLPPTNAGGAYRLLPKAGAQAYHLDNTKLVAFLQKKLEEFDVTIMHRKLIDARLEPETGDIASVATEEGESFSFDLYVDCSGFRSLLLGRALGVPFIDFSSSLFTNRAWAATVSHHGKIEPYTSAITMQHGWQWKIPLRDGDHIGYVYSDAFCSDDTALAELRQKHGKLHNLRNIKFTSGRRSFFWKGNVAAVGNSYGFVEPLESTGIHMIIQTVKTLIRGLQSKEPPMKARAEANRELTNTWDSIRWFLSAHFKYNKRIDSPFWSACQHDTDISGLEDILSVYLENGPLLKPENLSDKALNDLMINSVFSHNAYDLFFTAQGIFPHRIASQYLAKKQKDFEIKQQIWRKLAECALSYHEVVDLLRKTPSTITSLYDSSH